MPTVKMRKPTKASPMNALSYADNPAKFQDPDRPADREDGRLAIGESVVEQYRCVTNTNARNPIEATKEFQSLADSYRAINRPFERQYLHFPISYPRGERDVAKQKKHLDGTMSEFPQWQFYASMHRNTGANHWHCIVNTMQLDGKLIKTERLWEKVREASDKHARALKMEVLPEKSHLAERRMSMEERKAQDNGEELNITRVRTDAGKVLRATKTPTFVDLKQELETRGIELMRSGDTDGALIYKDMTSGRHFKASSLGDIYQLGGLRIVIGKGFDTAKKDIEGMGKNERMKDLNRAGVDTDYMTLKNAQKEENIRRDLCNATEVARGKAHSVEEYRAICRRAGVTITETDGKRFRYEFREEAFHESTLPMMDRKAEIVALYKDQDKEKNERTPELTEKAEKRQRVQRLDIALELAELETSKRSAQKSQQEIEQTAEIARGR